MGLLLADDACLLGVGTLPTDRPSPLDKLERGDKKKLKVNKKTASRRQPIESIAALERLLRRPLQPGLIGSFFFFFFVSLRLFFTLLF